MLWSLIYGNNVPPCSGAIKPLAIHNGAQVEASEAPALVLGDDVPEPRDSPTCHITVVAGATRSAQ